MHRKDFTKTTEQNIGLGPAAAMPQPSTTTEPNFWQLYTDAIKEISAQAFRNSLTGLPSGESPYSWA